MREEWHKEGGEGLGEGGEGSGKGRGAVGRGERMGEGREADNESTTSSLSSATGREGETDEGVSHEGVEEKEGII